MRSTLTGRNVLVLLLLFCSTTWAQKSDSPSLPANPVNRTGNPADAMQSSLAQQQAAIDSFRDTAQSNSLGQQRESVRAQFRALQSNAEPVAAVAPSPTTSPHQDSADPASRFFTIPWPGTLPFSMPNVQVANVSCDALAAGEVNKLIQGAATKHGVDSNLLRSVMKQESAFKPCALSVAGAMGLMQIMPDTAEMLHLDDPFDPEKNVDAGAKFLRTMLDRFGGDVAMALAAYNAGPGTVDRAGGVPPIAETLQYVSNILGDLPIAY
jgi:soluble lytic murein transglycosylase-like protein